jgi:hypothetical protein
MGCAFRIAARAAFALNGEAQRRRGLTPTTSCSHSVRTSHHLSHAPDLGAYLSCRHWFCTRICSRTVRVPITCEALQIAIDDGRGNVYGFYENDKDSSHFAGCGNYMLL